MFFVLSKIVYGLIAPSNLCAWLIGAGVLLGWRRRWRGLGRRLVVTGFVLLLVFGFSPLARWITKPLEDRFASAPLPAADLVTHIVLLGGFEDAGLSHGRDRILTNGSGERLLAIPQLARRYPGAKVVFSGGHGTLLGPRIDAADSIAEYLVAAGISRDRLVLEARSRNTWQNAQFVKEVLARRRTPCPCGFLLVTSAWHMPRAIGVFRHAGFARGDHRLFVYATDFRTRDGAHLWRPFGSLYDGLRLMELAVKEWLGLVAYRLTGRTASLWPSPATEADHRNAD